MHKEKKGDSSQLFNEEHPLEKKISQSSSSKERYNTQFIIISINLHNTPVPGSQPVAVLPLLSRFR